MWKKIQREYEKLLKEKEKGIVKNYKEALNKLEVEVRKIYDRYELDGQISMDELLKYNRMRKLDVATALVMKDLYKANDKLIKETLKQIIKKTEKDAVKTVDGIKRLNAIKRTFDIEAVINTRVGGRTWYERTGHRLSNTTYDIHTVIKAGLENGDTYTTMSKNLKDKLGSEIKNTDRVVRTESHRVQEFTKHETMAEINKQVKMNKTWHTVNDERVRSSHAEMEGVTIPFEDEFLLPSGATALYPSESGDPAEDINCRCWCSYEIAK
jgi:uncharacterized protein with gpF-like domain